jgi:4-aminobutyrate aminotransferase-like enzyme
MNSNSSAPAGDHNGNEDLLKLEAQYCSWGDTVHYAKELTMFSRSEGIYLYDDKDNQYLDLQMWYSAVNFGYGNPRLNAALKRQIDTLPQLACQYLHKEKILLATKLARKVEQVWGEKGRIHFNVGGASAVEDAWKIVRNRTKKNMAFAFMGGYHGRTLGATALTSSYRYRERYGHFGDRANFIPFPYCFRCPYGQKRESCGLYCLKQFERLFETEYFGVVNKTGQAEFGAFFVEAVQGTGGYVIAPEGYFPGLKKILDQHGILMVDDEIQMAFYRTGKFFALENFGTKPDVVVFGKALTNGMNPISAIWAREELISPAVFPPGSTHSTFSSNPLGTAVALETMKLMEEEDLETRVNRRGACFLSRLKELAKRYPQIGDVDGLGLALRIEMCQRDGFTPNRELTDAIMNIGLSGTLTAGGRSKGLILDVGGYYKNTFTVAPSLYITEQEIDTAVALFEEALKRGIAQTE